MEVICMGYDKQLFVENVYELAKLRGMKIKDLETGCGVSVGYISRLFADGDDEINSDLGGKLADFAVQVG